MYSVARILLVTLMRIWILGTFHFDADPHPNPSLQIKLKTLKKYSNSLIFHSTFWLVICKLMRNLKRIRIHNTGCVHMKSDNILLFYPLKAKRN